MSLPAWRLARPGRGASPAGASSFLSARRFAASDGGEDEDSAGNCRNRGWRWRDEAWQALVAVSIDYRGQASGVNEDSTVQVGRRINPDGRQESRVVHDREPLLMKRRG